MKTNSELRIQFINLCSYLNATNKHKNQKTQVAFYIDSSEKEKKFYIFINSNQRLVLAIKKELIWYTTQTTNYDELKNFFVFHLNSATLDHLSSDKLTEYLKYQLFSYSE